MQVTFEDLVRSRGTWLPGHWEVLLQLQLHGAKVILKLQVLQGILYYIIFILLCYQFTIYLHFTQTIFNSVIVADRAYKFTKMYSWWLFA